MPREKDYKKPFCTEDFRGYFKWTKVLSRRLQSHLYHACHRDELIKIIEDEALVLRSKWSLNLSCLVKELERDCHQTLEYSHQNQG